MTKKNKIIILALVGFVMASIVVIPFISRAEVSAPYYFKKLGNVVNLINPSYELASSTARIKTIYSTTSNAITLNVSGTSTLSKVVITTSSITSLTVSATSTLKDVYITGTLLFGGVIGSGGMNFDGNPGYNASYFQAGYFQATSTTANYFLGNVGIATTTPATKLDVWGSLQVGTSTTPTLTPVFIANTGNQHVGIGTSTPNTRLSILGISGEPVMHISSSTGSAILHIDEYGNVGIGTSTPSSPNGFARMLDVAGITGNVSVVIRNAGIGSAWEFGSETISGGSLGIFSGTNRIMTMLGTGNVGIGTTNPTFRLDVINSANTAESVPLMVRNSGTYGAGWRSSIGFGNALNDTILSEISSVGVDGSNIDLRFSTYGSGVKTDVVTFQGGGNVGIGTTSPSYHLDILGTSGSGALHIASSTGSSMLMIDQYGYLNVGSGSTNLIFDPINGYLGIGTTTPTRMLHLEGSSPNIRFTETDQSPIMTWHIGGSESDFTITETGIANRMVFKKTTGNVGIASSTPSSILTVDLITATTTVTIGGSGTAKGACLKLQDSDAGGWTYCSTLNGVMTCSQTSCE